MKGTANLLAYIHRMEDSGLPRGVAETIALGLDENSPWDGPIDFIRQLEKNGLNRDAAEVIAKAVVWQRDVWAERAAAARAH